MKVAVTRSYGLPTHQLRLYDFIANEADRLVPRAVAGSSSALAKVELGPPEAVFLKGRILAVAVGVGGGEHVMLLQQGPSEGAPLELRVSPAGLRARRGSAWLELPMPAILRLHIVVADAGGLPLRRRQYALPEAFEPLYSDVVNLRNFVTSNTAFTGFTHEVVFMYGDRMLTGGVIRTQKLAGDQFEATDSWALYFSPSIPLAGGVVDGDAARPLFCLILHWNLQAEESSSALSRFVASISGLPNLAAGARHWVELRRYVDDTMTWEDVPLPSETDVLLVSVAVARRVEPMHANELLEYEQRRLKKTGRA